MALKPWYTVVNPREDLREGKPLDASEFAVHLDQVRDGRAPAVYQKPEEFFARTFLTQYLLGLSAETVRRLSGIKTETSAVFNLTTQFGGGKTHALTLLYHLAANGPKSHRWPGVARILEKAGVPSVPKTAVAVFVGTEFDVISGRGGDDGAPQRRTPWGEIAFQLGGAESFAVVAEHDKQLTAPAGDVIRKFLPNGQPCLILMDEIMNYVSRGRKQGLAAQFYNFLQNLAEEARGRDDLVLAVSIPASELEMTADDQSDYERFKKLLDRVGKAVIMAAEAETSEIIRRRLFEWDEAAVSQDGRVMLSRDALNTCQAYSQWVADHRAQIPDWFPAENSRDAFAATYPFHPSVLSVFERKWQALPRFQRTRGILRLLALWVSRAHQDGYKGAHKDALITLGTAPLDDALFRAAMFEQLGEARLEGAVTTDIAGKKDAHALRLDDGAIEAIRKARLHRKVATSILFESNGGQMRAESTVPEIRLAVAEPEMDMGNIETALEALSNACYFLSVERSRYRFSFSPNLNKLLADYRANVKEPAMQERVHAEVQKVFAGGGGVDRIYFPEKSGQISDRPVLTFVVLPPDQSMQDEAKTKAVIETFTRESGTSGRTFKSALIWCVPDSSAALLDDARKVLALETIESEQDSLRLDDTQARQLAESLKKAGRDLKECVWRTYKYLVLLGKDNSLRTIDLGLVHSSAADSLVQFILSRLRQGGDVEDGISPNFLVRNWPPAFKEWSTKSVRDAFFAAPQFPRLLNVEAVKLAIARGVESGVLAYVGKTKSGDYTPFLFATGLSSGDVEISEEVFIITKEVAEAYRQAREAPAQPAQPTRPSTVQYAATPPTPDASVSELSLAASVQPALSLPPDIPATKLSWLGEIPAQKWMNFYTKVLSKFAIGKGLKLTVKVEIEPEGGVSPQKVEETKQSLRELGLGDQVKFE